jgi:hypothetical protein
MGRLLKFVKVGLSQRPALEQGLKSGIAYGLILIGFSRNPVLLRVGYGITGPFSTLRPYNLLKEHFFSVCGAEKGSAFDEGLKLANPADTAMIAVVYDFPRSGLTAENSVKNKRHLKKCIQLERVQVGMS